MREKQFIILQGLFEKTHLSPKRYFNCITDAMRELLQRSFSNNSHVVTFQEFRNVEGIFCVPPLVTDVIVSTKDLYSKIPWYPKLLFQRENALASF
jgi:hypothetical protein